MVDPDWFFPKQEGQGVLERTHVVRAANRRSLSGLYTRSTDELGFEDQLLSSTLSGQCYLILSRFPPGGGAPSDPFLPQPSAQPLEAYSFEGKQHALVLKGDVELRLEDEVITLSEGDSFSYPLMIAHRFRNANHDQEAVMVWAMSPVRIT